MTRRAMFVKPSKYTAKHFAQLMAAIVDVTTMGDPNAVVVPMAFDVTGDVKNVNDDCEFRVVRMQCEQECWKSVTEPPVTRQLEVMTGSMLLYVCCDCGGFLYIDHPDPRMVRDVEYAEKRELAANYGLVSRDLNKKLRDSVKLSRERAKRGKRKAQEKRTEKQ